MRDCQAIVTIQQGKGGSVQHRVRRVETYQTDESIDNDADTFSIQLNDSDHELESALDRDNEVRVNLFIDDVHGDLVPIFTGIADDCQRDETYTMTITGRDVPSAVAVDTDALPNRWRHMQPKSFIEGRAHALGIGATQIAQMSPIHSTYTDGSEKEWALWYRIARMKGMYIWTNHLAGGTLVIDKLGYSLTPSYLFGDPPRGQARNAWIPGESLLQASTKAGRIHEVIIYGSTAKKSTARSLIARSQDITIPNWKKKSTKVMSSTKARTAKELQTEAHTEMFETIVGAIEYQLTIHDDGTLIQQNRMCRINLPDYGLVGNYFVVGVQRSGSANGFTQTVRVREKGFALSKRIPDPPTLTKTKVSVSDDYKPASSIAAALAGDSGIRWPDSFVRATREYGGAWDFAVFLGALLSICEIETGFKNERQGGGGHEWFSRQDQNLFGGGYHPPPAPDQVTVTKATYDEMFANDPGNPRNPLSPANAGVGPMQLTDSSIKAFADNLGWNGQPLNDEYEGGRWNPDSNIRAAAKLLADKGTAANADPTNADNIWMAVQGYNGAGPAAVAYANHARQLYSARFGAEAVAAVSLPKAIMPGSTNTAVNIPGHGVIPMPANAPGEVLKIIAFALSKLGDPYLWSGTGPLYDCSSFVTAALSIGAPYLKNSLDEPYPGHHGEDTITLFAKGQSVPKDALAPADLVFFVAAGTPEAPDHVGMYLGDGLLIHDPGTGQFVSVSGIGEQWFVNNYCGARRYVIWTPGI